AAMDDDFNTANAITVLFDLSKDANLYLNVKQTNSEVIELFQEKLVNLSEILGISLDDATPELLDEEIDRLIVERDEARADKNFERADEFRDLLQEYEIILKDKLKVIRLNWCLLMYNF